MPRQSEEAILTESSEMGSRYPAYRIALHWGVVALIITQWLTSGAIQRTHNTLLPPSSTDLFLHGVHNYSGMTIGLLVGIRVLLRLFRPVPAAPLQPHLLRRLSAATHWGLYLSLMAQAGTGFVTAYLWSGAGQVHVFFWNVTLTLVAIHIGAALLHAVRSDGVLSRMLPAIPGLRIGTAETDPG
jgi:cytochrome b561